MPKMPWSILSSVDVRLPSFAAMTCQAIRNCAPPAFSAPCQSPASGDCARHAVERTNVKRAMNASLLSILCFIDLLACVEGDEGSLRAIAVDSEKRTKIQPRGFGACQQTLRAHG